MSVPGLDRLNDALVAKLYEELDESVAAATGPSSSALSTASNGPDLWLACVDGEERRDVLWVLPGPLLALRKLGPQSEVHFVRV